MIMQYYISKEKPLILASTSPRRKKLLNSAGIPFIVEQSNISEDFSETLPELITTKLAFKKASAVHANRKWWTLGADTIVTYSDIILGKPCDTADAVKMLKTLSGKEHIVTTGFCIIDPSGDKVHSESVSTSVYLKELSADEIERYVATGESFGKAGACAIQGIGAFMVEKIKGSYSNVVGLPICELIQALIKNQAIPEYPIVL